MASEVAVLTPNLSAAAAPTGDIVTTRMVFSTACLLLSLCALPQQPANKPAPADPEATAAGRKSYLGREVAHTMHWAPHVREADAGLTL